MKKLNITNLKPWGPFLTIYGHDDSGVMKDFQEKMIECLPNLSRVYDFKLEVGELYIFVDLTKKECFRCTPMNATGFDLPKVKFIDYGFDREISMDNEFMEMYKLNTTSRSSLFVYNFPIIAERYILKEFCCDWQATDFALVKQQLNAKIIEIKEELTNKNFSFISFNVDGRDFKTKLISNGLGQETSVTQQLNRLDTMAEEPKRSSGINRRLHPGRNLTPTRPLQQPIRNSLHNHAFRHLRSALRNNDGTVETPASHTTSSSLPVFIGTDLAIGSHHLVYVSYINDGPNLFSVQLKNQEHTLDRMMNDLANEPLKNLRSKPVIGQACVARHSEDKVFYRAVIVNFRPDSCRVTYVDYGKSEEVPFEHVYEIPPKYLELKTFAIQFSLQNSKTLEPIDRRLELHFEKLVTKVELEMKVMPMDGSTFVQYCELFYENRSVLELLRKKRSELYTYPKPRTLVDKDIVIIRFANTAKQLYVQRIEDIPQFELMMDELLRRSREEKPLTRLPSPGDCCAAIINNDENEWYRVQVLEQLDFDRVRVEYVDYGPVADIQLKHLRRISLEMIALPRQVNECCLVDFKDVENVSLSTGKHIELLAEDSEQERNTFKVVLNGRLPHGAHIINLIDTADQTKDMSSIVHFHSMPRNKNKSRDATSSRPNDKEHQNGKAMPVSSVQKRVRIQQPDGTDGIDTQRNFVEGRETTADWPQEKRDQNYNEVVDADRQSKNRNGKSTQNQPNSGDQHNNNNPRNSDRRSSENNNQQRRPERNIGDNRRSEESGEDFVGFPKALPDQLIPIGSNAKVSLTFWMSPHDFYVKLKSHENDCDLMLKRMEKTFRNHGPTTTKPSVGDFVVVRLRAEQIFQRAKVVDYNVKIDKYRVMLIDVGSRIICSINDIYEMEKSLVHLPPLAISCSFSDIIRLNSIEKIQQEFKTHYYELMETMMCEFVRSDGGKTFVELRAGNIDLRIDLIQRQLIASLPKDVDMKLLTDQTLLVRIVEVESLLAFRVKFTGCDIEWMCAYKDAKAVKNNRELNEEFRKRKNGNVVVRIESVTDDNVLRLSIFLPNLDGVAGVGIPKFAIYRDNTEVIVTHVESPHEIYIQPVKLITHLESFLSDLYEFYSKSDKRLESPNVGDLCCVLSADKNYYRATIVQPNEDDTFKVRYIDYGNCENVARDNIKEFDFRFASENRFAVKMFVPIASITPSEQIVKEIEKLTGENEFFLKVLKRYRGQWVIDLLSHAFKLTNLLQKKSLADVMDAEKMREIIDATSVTMKPKRDKSRTQAFISHANNPNDFYMNLKSDQDALDKMQSNLQLVAASLSPLDVIRVGGNCIAKYSVDDEWYRAKIIDSDGDITSIQFIDYGNTDSITDKSLLKETNASFDRIKSYKIHCSLALEPRSSTAWSDEASKILLDIANDEIEFETIVQCEEMNYVKLFAKERNISRELLAGGHAEPMQIIKSNVKCFISHVNSLDDFYIQMHSDSNALKLIEEFLSDISKFEPLTQVEPMTICVAPFDDGYYRAKVLSIDPSTKEIEVLYIDYGNEGVVKEVRKLPQNIADLPQLRKRCSLKKPDDIEQWSNEAINKFEQITESAELVARLVRPGVNMVLELFLNGRNIGDDLKELCEKFERAEPIHDESIIITVPTVNLPKERCFVSHVNSPLDFYVQFASQIDQLNDIAEKVSATVAQSEDIKLDDIKVGAIVAAYSDKFSDFYRAKVLEITENGAHVLFIDYGNEATTNRLRKLTDELLGEPMAMHCMLCGIGRAFNEREMNQLTNILRSAIDADDKTFHDIQIVNPNARPIEVNLFEKSKNVVTLVGAKIVETYLKGIFDEVASESAIVHNMVDNMIEMAAQV